MKVLVCGGRKYTNAPLMSCKLNELLELHPNLIVIHGNAEGAERIAKEWCLARGVPTLRFNPSATRLHGKGPWNLRAAWNIRTQEALNWGEPNLVLAFPGGEGTKAIVERAEAHGVPVRKVGW